MKQNTSTVLMVAPTRFGFNEETAASNSFQNKPSGSTEKIQVEARKEFDRFVQTLKNVGIEVLVFEDNINSTSPDSIFPNNWFSTHSTGDLILYPMAAPNRRAERNPQIIDQLIKDYQFTVHDLSEHEINGDYLEGTGSLIFDHDNKVVYAAVSPRTNENVVNELADILGYQSVCFEAYGKSGELIYHTNVMMCVGDKFIIISTDTIADNDKERVIESLRKSNKTIVELSNEQTYDHFAGNMLQLNNKQGETVLVMSLDAHTHLNPDQKETLSRLNEHLVTADIPMIEKIGGGSARCMLAEIFKPTL